MPYFTVHTARVAAAAIAVGVIGGTSAIAQPFAFSGPQHQTYSSPRGSMPGERLPPPAYQRYQSQYPQQMQQPSQHQNEHATPAQPRAAHTADHLRRQIVNYTPRRAAPGTIIIDTANTYLYLVLDDNRAMRYGIGVGREGFAWSGSENIARKAEWPDWRPPESMIQRQPYLPRFMAGGEGNPMGARALYLGNSLYRIHGTNEPHTIGSKVSSGCIRMINEDVIDLYQRVNVGARVIVMPDGPRTAPEVVAARSNPQPVETMRQEMPQRPTQIGSRTWRSGVY